MCTFCDLPFLSCDLDLSTEWNFFFFWPTSLLKVGDHGRRPYQFSKCNTRIFAKEDRTMTHSLVAAHFLSEHYVAFWHWHLIFRPVNLLKQPETDIMHTGNYTAGRCDVRVHGPSCAQSPSNFAGTWRIKICYRVTSLRVIYMTWETFKSTSGFIVLFVLESVTGMSAWVSKV